MKLTAFQALNWLENRLWRSGIQNYYQQEAQKAKEEQEKKENEPVRLTREWYQKKYGL